EPITADAAVIGASCHEVLTHAGGKSTSWDGYFTGTAVRTERGWQLRDGHWSRKTEPAAEGASEPCNPDFDDCSREAVRQPPAPQGVVGPGIRSGQVSVMGHLSVAEVRHVVEVRFPALGDCYMRGAVEHPGLRGRLVVKFVVDRSGAMAMIADDGSDLPSLMALCMLRTIEGASFPPPPGGMVTVVYPISFAPE
ncbi:MAG TPA: AgmX/PglI C-terminal domain-containing protein, partial [Polyangiaceae bacterium]